MNAEVIQAQLPPLLKTLLGLPVNWATQEQRMHTSARAEINILSDVELQLPDVLWKSFPSAAVAYLSTQSVMALQVLVWAPAQKIHVSARKYLMDLRRRLRFPSTLETLRALGLGLGEVGGIVDLDETEGGRVVSKAAMEIQFAHAEMEADGDQSWIETARITSEFIRNPAGEPTEIQIDLNPPES